LGGSAALSVASIRALSSYAKITLTDEKLNDMAYECEKIFHGTPSGIDNSAVSFEKPMYFQDKRVEFLNLKNKLVFYIIYTGKKADTKSVVESVRKNLDHQLIKKIGKISQEGRPYVISGDIRNIGRLMNENQKLLVELGVSSREIDDIVAKATGAGALGAKLTGKGKGGCVIALVDGPFDKNLEEVFKDYEYYITVVG
jgi:mevalonate kinase